MLQNLKNPMTDEPFINPIDDEAYTNSDKE